MTDDGVRRCFLIICILFAIACAGYICAIYLLNIETETMFLYFVKADALWNGDVPSIEYPPLALAFMILPRMLASDPFWYNMWYVTEVYVFMIAGLYIACRLAERFEYSEKKAMIAYGVMMLLMLEFVTDRFDIFPMVLTLLSFYCICTKRYVPAFALLSLGMMTKLYPAVLFPIYLVPLIIDRKWTDAAKGTAAFVLTAFAVAVPVMIAAPDMISDFIGYHTDRPLHIESAAGSFIYLLAMIGLTNVSIISAKVSYGSDNLLGPLPDSVFAILTPVMILSVLAVCAAYAYAFGRTKNGSERDVLTGSTMLAALLAFMVMGKVFSSQYLIWIIPPLIFMLITGIDEKTKRIIYSVTIIAMILTQLNFAYNIGYLGGGENINDIGMMILFFRNIAVIVLLYVTVKHAFGRYAAAAERAVRCSEDG